MFKISFQKMDMLPFIRFISFLCMSCVCPQYVQTTSSKISYRNVQVVQSCVRSNLKWITNLWRNTLQDHIIIGTSRILCVIVLWREMRKEKLTSQFRRTAMLQTTITHTVIFLWHRMLNTWKNACPIFFLIGIARKLERCMVS